MRQKPNPDTRCAVYRWFAFTGRLLYIGCSVDPDQRWQALRQTESWTHLAAWRTLEWYESIPEAKAAERAAIKTEDALFNMQGVAGGNGRSVVKRALELPDGTSIPCQRRNGRWHIGDDAIRGFRAVAPGSRLVAPGIVEHRVGSAGWAALQDND